MTNNVKRIPEKIKLTAEQEKEVRDILMRYYKAMGYKGRISEKIDDLVKACSAGWRRAPDNFWKRVFIKCGDRTGLLKSLIEKHGTFGTVDALYVRRKHSSSFSGMKLDKKDRVFLSKREQQYRQDYDFNDSSDLPLLREVLLDELLLKKLQEKRVVGEYDPKTEAALDKIHKRIQDNMDKLGILRKQRSDDELLSEGNISVLAFSLNEKLNNMQRLKDKVERKAIFDTLIERFSGLTVDELNELVEEAVFMKKKNMRGEVNPIPKSEVNKILKDLK